MRKLEYSFQIFFVSFLLLSCNKYSDRSFWSPYEDINWAEVDYCDAQFHTHPGLGDEQYDPHQTIDRYYDEGYKILTIAGHDYHIPTEQIGSLYPWTELAFIYETIKDIENPSEGNRTYGDIANEPYENRNPLELGMVSVEGCEVSAPHHLISLFSSFSSGGETEDETFRQINNLGGLAYFAHPGRYVERRGLTADWYIDFYQRYDILLGQAIFNREDSNPGDRDFFDKIVHLLGSDRPIWLFGEDDMHTESTLGWNRNVILIENFEPGSMHPSITDGSSPDVREALKKGRFYLWKPSEQYNKRSFNISNIKLSKNKIELEFDQVDKIQSISWVTYDPERSSSHIFHEGNLLSMKNVPQSAKFVRAEIEGDDGTIYTQPFYIFKKINQNNRL